MTDGTQRVGADIDKKLYEAVKAKTDHGEISEEIRNRLREIAYGTEVSERQRLKEQLTDLRKQRRDLEAEISDKQRERDEVERKIERVEDRLGQLEDMSGKYDGMLETIESQLHDGVRFPPGGPPIQKAADMIDGDADDVIADLKERNPNVPDAAFRPARDDEPPRWNQHNTTTLNSIK